MTVRELDERVLSDSQQWSSLIFYSSRPSCQQEPSSLNAATGPTIIFSNISSICLDSARPRADLHPTLLGSLLPA